MGVNIQKTTLLNILSAAQSKGSALSENDKKAIRELQEQLCAKSADEMHLVDCSAYVCANFWGYTDVLNSAMSNTEWMRLSKLSPKEVDQVINLTMLKINWGEVEDAAWRGGKKVIDNALNSVLADIFEN